MIRKKDSLDYDDEMYLVDIVVSDMHNFSYKPNAKSYIKKRYTPNDPLADMIIEYDKTKMIDHFDNFVIDFNTNDNNLDIIYELLFVTEWTITKASLNEYGINIGDNKLDSNILLIDKVKLKVLKAKEKLNRINKKILLKKEIFNLHFKEGLSYDIISRQLRINKNKAQTIVKYIKSSKDLSKLAIQDNTKTNYGVLSDNYNHICNLYDQNLSAYQLKINS
jgi:hypothetical protein